MTAKKTSCVGMRPKIFELMALEYMRGNLLTALPSVMTMPMPVNSSDVPSVARIGGMRTLETRKPLKAPAAAPMRMAMTKHSGMTYTAISFSSVATAFISVAVQMETRLATPTVDRSMPPVIMHTMMPRDMRPNSGNWEAMVWKLMSV